MSEDTSRTRARGPKPTDEPGSRAAAYRAAIRLLEHQDRTVADLRKRLTARGFDADVVVDTLDRLQRDGFVNDARYAERYASSMRELRGYGARRIQLELSRRGVDQELVASASSVARADEQATADALALKRAQRLPSDMPREQALRRLAGHLSRKGFGPDIVWAAAKRALDTAR